jgi:hypothetical protein
MRSLAALKRKSGVRGLCAILESVNGGPVRNFSQRSIKDNDPEEVVAQKGQPPLSVYQKIGETV